MFFRMLMHILKAVSRHIELVTCIKLLIKYLFILYRVAASPLLKGLDLAMRSELHLETEVETGKKTVYVRTICFNVCQLSIKSNYVYFDYFGLCLVGIFLVTYIHNV